MGDAININNEINVKTFHRQICPYKETLICAITKLPHANLLTFHIILSKYYHNHKIQHFYFSLFKVVVTWMINKVIRFHNLVSIQGNLHG